MATTKKNSYISEELEWLEERANEIKKSVEREPYDSLTDRIVILDTPKGPAEKVVQVKENIQKARREALKDYAFLMEVINKLREAEEKKIEARGSKEIGGMMASKLNK